MTQMSFAVFVETNDTARIQAIQNLITDTLRSLVEPVQYGSAHTNVVGIEVRKLGWITSDQLR